MSTRDYRDGIEAWLAAHFPGYRRGETESIVLQTYPSSKEGEGAQEVVANAGTLTSETIRLISPGGDPIEICFDIGVPVK